METSGTITLEVRDMTCGDAFKDEQRRIEVAKCIKIIEGTVGLVNKEEPEYKDRNGVIVKAGDIVVSDVGYGLQTHQVRVTLEGKLHFGDGDIELSDINPSEFEILKDLTFTKK